MDLIYTDAPIFISWLQGDAGEEHQKVYSLISEIADGKYKVVVSAILLTEVFREHKKRKLDISHFDKLFTRFQVRPADEPTARIALNFRQDFGLKTPDAIHLATAVRAKAKYLCTLDKDLLDLDGEVGGIKIAKTPPLTHQPSFTSQT